jgi:hypothetical protein
MTRVVGPFEIVEKINDNAYKLELPPEFGVSPTFNISYLRPYLGDEDELVSRMTPIQEDDEDITHSHTHNDPLLDIQGPITRARARQLNLEVSSFLSNSLYDFENRLLHNDYIVLRIEEEIQETHGGGLGGVEVQRGLPNKDGGPNQVEFEFASQSRSSQH